MFKFNFEIGFNRNPKKQGQIRRFFKRMYAAAKSSRLTTGWGRSTTTADSELITSLTNLRNRSREMVRDTALAKRAKTIVINNIVGEGIGMQAQVQNPDGTLNERVNGEIEESWYDWCDSEKCHVGGRLHFSDIERMAIGENFEAGEFFVRKHFAESGDSGIPYALETIESEKIPHEFQYPNPTDRIKYRMGVEVDGYYRPLAYWIKLVHPGELHLRFEEVDKIERVPAAQIIHLAVINRWPQTRGEPWMHAALRKLNDLDGYTEAEIIAARGAACYMATLETQGGESTYPEKQEDGSSQIVLEPGTVPKLNPGEKLNFNNPNRPNSQADPFIRVILREIAAGIGCSYESLSRDYSQSNYSSSRLALLDDRDLWKILQKWFILSFRYKIHRDWIRQAILSRAIKSISVEEYAINPRKYEAVRFKPRGWSWIDPKSEVEAYKLAVLGGFMTVSDVISITGNGNDLEDVLKGRQRELKLMEQMGLKFDTDIANKNVQQNDQPNNGNGNRTKKQIEEIIDAMDRR